MHESYSSPQTLYVVFENGESHEHLASLIISFCICILSERLGLNMALLVVALVGVQEKCNTGVKDSRKTSVEKKSQEKQCQCTY